MSQGLSPAEMEVLAEATGLAKRVSIIPNRQRRNDEYCVYEQAHLYYSDEERLNKALQPLVRIGYKPAVYRNKRIIAVLKQKSWKR